MRTSAVLAAVAAIGIAGCAAAPVDPTDTTWTLVDMFGDPVTTDEVNRPVTLTLEGAGTANGYAGCNQFSGPFTLTGDRLTFGNIAMTRMACDRGMEVERLFSNVLDRTERWVVADGMLHLIATDGLLARFRR